MGISQPQHQTAQIIIIHIVATGFGNLLIDYPRNYTYIKVQHYRKIIMHRNREIAVKNIVFPSQYFLILTSEIAFLKSVDKFRYNRVK